MNLLDHAIVTIDTGSKIFYYIPSASFVRMCELYIASHPDFHHPPL